ncbi:C2H2-type zinc finger protein [Saliphagus sp. GCM10025334]
MIADSDDEPTWSEPTAAASRCQDCGRPFTTEERRLLHRGLEHPDRLSARERETYATVAAAERGAHRRYVLGALLVLVVTYFGFLFAYAIVA